MISETFVHFPGIGRLTESRLWQSGILTWEQLKDTRLGSRPEVAGGVRKSRAALETKNMGFFFSRLPSAEKWRTFVDFGTQFAGVDIETTGLSIYDRITLIGIEEGGKYHVFIRGSNLEDAREMLESQRGFLTFNGSLFDLPFIRREWPDIRLPEPHIDLRFLGRRVGFRGGLKTVEQGAGLTRPDEIRDLGGYAATVLWSQFVHGNLRALRLLIEYNAADTCVLRRVCEIIVKRLAEELASEFSGRMAKDLLFAPPKPRFATYRARKAMRVRLPSVTVGPKFVSTGSRRIPAPVVRVRGPGTTIQALLRRMRNPNSRIVGIDLCGSENRRTGWALLEGDLVISRPIWKTEDIVRQTITCRPYLVSIDSPLSIPEGRDCTSDECECRKHGITRACERELRRRGIGVYPCLIQSMRSLTERGIRLAGRLRSGGVRVIESYPGAAQDIIGIPRKKASRGELWAGLCSVGIRGIPRLDLVTNDELDAVTSALVGTFYLAGMYEALGTRKEDYLIVPRLIDAGEKEENPVSDSLIAHGPFLIMFDGAVEAEVVERVADPLEACPVLSVDRAHMLLREGRNVVMLRDGAEGVDQLVASLGPRVRVVFIADRKAGRRLKKRAFCDLVLETNKRRTWAADLRTWLADLKGKGGRICH